MTTSPDTIPTIGTGAEIEEQSFIWEINNFDVIVKEDSMIKLQSTEFTAGNTIGHRAQWVVFLTVKEKDGKRGIGVFYKVKGSPPKITAEEYLFTQILIGPQFNKDGRATKTYDGGLRNISAFTNGADWGFDHLLNVTDIAGLKRLEIKITFKLYSKAKTVSQLTAQQAIDKFQPKMLAQAHEDLGGLVQNPMPGDMKLLSSDRVEFSMPMGILAVRSPVFEAMFRADMTEVKDGLIRLSEISGKTLKIYCNFLYTGKLLPEWKESSGVVLELTNVAAQYQHTDLLEFLDLVLGKVCDLENVAPLWSLANKLSMKTAEGELLKYIREKGVSSSDNFSQIANAIAAMSPPPQI